VTIVVHVASEGSFIGSWPVQAHTGGQAHTLIDHQNEAFAAAVAAQRLSPADLPYTDFAIRDDSLVYRVKELKDGRYAVAQASAASPAETEIGGFDNERAAEVWIMRKVGLSPKQL
jgi:hypothetical protein